MSIKPTPGDPWYCADEIGSLPTVPAVRWSQNTTAIQFRNADGIWTIYKQCLDRTSDGRRHTVGPGYVARLERSSTPIVDDHRGRTDTWSPGYINAVNGGLGTFGWHHARGPVGNTPAGDDPTTSAVETDVGRTPQVIEGRMCAATNDGHGVYARNWYGPTLESPTKVNYTMDVWLRDRYRRHGLRPGRERDRPPAVPVQLLPLVRQPVGSRDDLRGAERGGNSVREGAEVHCADARW